MVPCNCKNHQQLHVFICFNQSKPFKQTIILYFICFNQFNNLKPLPQPMIHRPWWMASGEFNAAWRQQRQLGGPTSSWQFSPARAVHLWWPPASAALWCSWWRLSLGSPAWFTSNLPSSYFVWGIVNNHHIHPYSLLFTFFHTDGLLNHEPWRLMIVNHDGWCLITNKQYVYE